VKNVPLFPLYLCGPLNALGGSKAPVGHRQQTVTEAGGVVGQLAQKRAGRGVAVKVKDRAAAGTAHENPLSIHIHPATGGGGRGIDPLARGRFLAPNLGVKTPARLCTLF